MKSWFAIGLIVALCVRVSAETVDDRLTHARLRSDPIAAQVLTNKYIYIETTNTVPVDYVQMLTVLTSDDLLTTVQSAYEAILEDDEEKEFTITRTGETRYSFVNSKGETSEIFELLRRESANEPFELAVLSQGKRFFGDYKALVHLVIQPDDDGHCAYRAYVYAYPRNGVVRFVARKLNLIERFFHKKTEMIVNVATRVSLYLSGETPSAQWTDAEETPISSG